jgi:hypothetical protein
MVKSCVGGINGFGVLIQHDNKMTYSGGKRPRIEGTQNKSPVRDGQELHPQANVNTLFGREILVRELIEQHFGTRRERAHRFAQRRRFQDKQLANNVVPLVHLAFVYDLYSRDGDGIQQS